MIRRPPRSTPLYSSAASDVYKRQLKDRHGGWTRAEAELTNAIISLRTGLQLTMVQIRAIVEFFPEKMLNLPCSKDKFQKQNFFAELSLNGEVIIIAVSY